MQKNINHFSGPSFWTCYEKLPAEVKKLADKNYEVLKSNPEHPSLHFKRIGKYRSVRVGLSLFKDAGALLQQAF